MKKKGQNHDIESIYEPNIKCHLCGEQEGWVLERITSKIKEFIQYYGFTKATLQRCENQEFGRVLARKCSRDWTL